MEPSGTARRYRGVTAAERSAGRRERLLDAGLELFGTRGYASTSIAELSKAASLNSRYFYESFSSREDLLYHVYLRIVTDLAASAAAAIAQEPTIEGQARAALRAGWIAMTDDRRKARIVALEVVGVSNRLEKLRRDTRHALADITVTRALAVADRDTQLTLDPVLTARFLIGGVIEILVEWIEGYVDAPVDDVIEHFTRLFTAAAYAAVAGEDSVGDEGDRRTTTHSDARPEHHPEGRDNPGRHIPPRPARP
jgi:AcrR family transcriptional regulator